MRLWIWNGVRVELPEDWEMLQYATNADVGRCGFADRYQYRFELNWRSSEGAPDVRRMMEDYFGKMQTEGTLENPKRVRQGAWQGIEGRLGGVPTSRFGRWLAPANCMVEVVFLWPTKRETALEQSVLRTVDAEPETKGLQRWRAFGMDCRVTADLSKRSCRVEPAWARLAFADAGKGTREEAFERRGLVALWMQEDVKTWLARQVPAEVKETEEDGLTRAGHEVRVVRGMRRHGMLRASSRYQAAAWVCPEDGRLYWTAVTDADDGPVLTLPGNRLTCCGALETG